MDLKVCVDRILPEERQGDALLRSVEENSRNAVLRVTQDGAAPAANTGAVAVAAAAAVEEPLHLAAVSAKMWAVGRNLRVRFLNGDPTIQNKIVDHAKRWLQYADINFTFGNDPQAEIRIEIASDGAAWSNVGTDALSVPQNEATMHYGWFDANTADDEYERTVVHEFGHALGCIHEHQNPAGNIQWNKDAVYRYYMGPPNNWTKDQVNHNLFEKYSASITQFSALDAQSIMMYPIPAQFTTNGFSVGWNKQLSAMDKTYIARFYPPYQVRINMTSAEYQAAFNDLTSKGFRLACVSGYNVGGPEKYAACFTKVPYPGMTAWQARHGMTSAQYQQNFDTFVGQGYRLVDVSGYQVGNEARYAALWIKAPGPAFVARHGLTGDQYQQAFNQYVSQGYRLVHVSGYGVNNTAYYAAIFEKNNGTAFVARHGLTGDQYQQAFNQNTAQGYRLTDVSGYRVGNQVLYAAVWTKVGGPGYQARHGVKGSDFAELNKQFGNQGFVPTRIDGYGSGAQDLYAGIWEAYL